MKKLTKIAKSAPDVGTLLFALIVVVDLLQSSVLSNERWFGEADTLGLVSASLASLAVSFLVRNNKLDELMEQIGESESEKITVLEKSDYPDFSGPFANAKSIDILSISGTKNANLGSLDTLQSLFSNSQNKKIRILLANPDSEALKQRYDKDEPQTSEVGLEGLRRRLHQLQDELAKLSTAQKRKVSIRIYDSYPTLSFVAVNDVYYWTVFGYKLRGSDCPKMVVEDAGRIATFLARQFDNIYDDAIDLVDWTKGQT